MSTRYAHMRASGALVRLNDGFPIATKFGLSNGYGATSSPADLFSGGLAAAFAASWPAAYTMLGDCAVWVETSTGQVKYEVADSLKAATGLSAPVSIGDPLGDGTHYFADLGSAMLLLSSVYSAAAGEESYPSNMTGAGADHLRASILYLEDHVGAPVPAIKQWILRQSAAEWASTAAVSMAGKEFYDTTVGMISLRGVIGYALQYGSGGFVTDIITGVFDMREEFAPFLTLYAGVPPAPPPWWDLRSTRLAEV